jgi:hypothetical protein
MPYDKELVLDTLEQIREALVVVKKDVHIPKKQMIFATVKMDKKSLIVSV